MIPGAPLQLRSQLDTGAGEFQKELQVPTGPHPAAVTDTEPASAEAPQLYRQDLSVDIRPASLSA